MGSPTDLARLVAAAADGDATAWETLVDRYARLVVAVCRRYRLAEIDVADVSQTVWLRLVDHLPTLRDPDALPGWLVTTARNESLRMIRSSRRTTAFDFTAGGLDVAAEDDPPDRQLLAAERDAVLRAAFEQLPEPCRNLLRLLISDPPLSYAEISTRLGVPIGSIGPSRARCLDRLRRSPVLAAVVGPADAVSGR